MKSDIVYQLYSFEGGYTDRQRTFSKYKSRRVCGRSSF